MNREVYSCGHRVTSSLTCSVCQTEAKPAQELSKLGAKDIVEFMNQMPAETKADVALRQVKEAWSPVEPKFVDKLVIGALGVGLAAPKHLLEISDGNSPIVGIDKDGTVTIYKLGGDKMAAKLFYESLQFEGKTLHAKIGQLTAAIEAERARAEPTCKHGSPALRGSGDCVECNESSL